MITIQRNLTKQITMTESVELTLQFIGYVNKALKREFGALAPELSANDIIGILQEEYDELTFSPTLFLPNVEDDSDELFIDCARHIIGRLIGTCGKTQSNSTNITVNDFTVLYH